MYSILLQTGGGSGNMMNLLFIVGMVAVFYFFMIRPQQKKQKEQKSFLESLKRGDKIVTIGGMHGTILSIEGNTVLVEADQGVKLKFEKSAISQEQTKAAYGKTEAKA
ncbi:preprotein translocase subunit YajC [Thermoflexibacter ruber]|uniref:Sec translocon accessory complex subunit YajC n=1 Tax=Thermoflexibacter ruber TaxID=1003 RepID=A0A1I2EFN1_9BACT|nr:preprotein translocase subunit YajC [Thermoflexibacter ruber]SFE91854.1 preprotein translocase subunit YajC [Thermoflexibacter ruber]